MKSVQAEAARCSVDRYLLFAVLREGVARRVHFPEVIGGR